MDWMNERENKDQDRGEYSFCQANPLGQGGLLNNMRDMTMIYNHTEAICFDQHKVYLITE